MSLYFSGFFHYNWEVALFLFPPTFACHPHIFVFLLHFSIINEELVLFRLVMPLLANNYSFVWSFLHAASLYHFAFFLCTVTSFLCFLFLFYLFFWEKGVGGVLIYSVLDSLPCKIILLWWNLYLFLQGEKEISLTWYLLQIILARNTLPIRLPHRSEMSCQICEYIILSGLVSSVSFLAWPVIFFCP